MFIDSQFKPSQFHVLRFFFDGNPNVDHWLIVVQLQKGITSICGRAVLRRQLIGPRQTPAASKQNQQQTN